MVADNPKGKLKMNSTKRISRALPITKALDRMRTGSRLMRMHGRGQGWFVLPGGEVDNTTANTIINHPSVIGERDGLFPQHDQTWRMRTFVQSA
jgi:hypothetical protein